MPDKLCKDCTEKAYLAYNFKITIEQNDSTLRSVLLKDHIESIKKDAVFDENNTYLGLGIKTEIAFVDADPFIDDDADFDYVNATTENSNPADQQQQQQLDNNNSYQQDDQEEILQLEEEELGEMEGENGEGIEEELDESLESISSKDKIKRKDDYIKDEDGKFICQICNKKLADKKGLNLHIRLHTGKDLKRCHICNRGKKF
jgi:RNase P subunit RPR2